MASHNRGFIVQKNLCVKPCIVFFVKQSAVQQKNLPFKLKQKIILYYTFYYCCCQGCMININQYLMCILSVKNRSLIHQIRLGFTKYNQANLFRTIYSNSEQLAKTSQLCHKPMLSQPLNLHRHAAEFYQLGQGHVRYIS